MEFTDVLCNDEVSGSFTDSIIMLYYLMLIWGFQRWIRKDMLMNITWKIRCLLSKLFMIIQKGLGTITFVDALFEIFHVL